MAGHAAEDARILEGVERVCCATTGALCFPGSLAACARFLGEDVSNEYVLGVSGGAFKTFWLAPWAPSNCDLLVIGEQPVRRAFRALGRGYTYLPDYGACRAYPRERYREEIVRSIDAGVPVIAIGIIGPPEACLVTGYERGGDFLHGTSYFQWDETGFFQTDDWYTNIRGLIVVEGPQPKPPAKYILTKTLEWAIRLARTPFFGEREWKGPEATEMPPMGLCAFRHVNGLAAYSAMADMARRDADFEDLSPEALELRCYALGHDGVSLMLEERKAAATFLCSFTDEGYDGTDHLRKAAETYMREVAVLKEAVELAPLLTSPEEHLRYVLRPEQRRLFAALICEAGEYDERAVEHMEKALGDLKGS